MLHIVAKGSRWVSLGSGERHWAREGDVIVLPYGDLYRAGGVEPAACVPIFSLLAPPPWERLPVLRHGAGGPATEIVCGYLDSDDPLFDPGMRALPPVFVVRPPEGPVANWVRSSVDYALGVSSANAPPQTQTRLPELLLVEILRLYLASTPTDDHGWTAALRDPVIAPALARLHAMPERRWTGHDLASETAVSRSSLDERFRRILGRSPIRYLTEWRMRIASDMLALTDLGVADRSAGRLRLRGGVQPGVQAHLRRRAQHVARREATSPGRVMHRSDGRLARSVSCMERRPT